MCFTVYVEKFDVLEKSKVVRIFSEHNLRKTSSFVEGK